MNAKGRLLVATPAIAEATFFRSVVLVLEHDPAGALGVVINRPGDIDVEHPFPGWAPLASDPAVLFVGGPVEPAGAIALGQTTPAAASGAPGVTPVLPGLATIDLEVPPILLTGAVSGVRFFAGYSGWTARQLDDELAAGGWWVIDAEPDDAFDPDPDTLWRRVLARQPGRLRMYAAYPDDPADN